MTQQTLIVALGVALVAAAVAAVAIWRVRDRADKRVAEAIAELAAGMHQTMLELAEAVEAAQASAHAERFTSELAASLDLDEVTGRTLEAAGSVAGVEAALLEAAAADGGRISATVGISADEAARTAVRVPENDNLRAVEITYHYRLDDADGESQVVRSGLVVPIRADGVPVGTLSAFSRSSQGRLSSGELDQLEGVASRAGPALDNARRYSEARQLADLAPTATSESSR